MFLQEIFEKVYFEKKSADDIKSLSAISLSVIVAFPGHTPSFLKTIAQNSVPEAFNNHVSSCPSPGFSNIHDVVLIPCHAL